MKARGKNALLLLTGMLVGLALAPTAVHAVSELLTATPSTQTFYVNGQRVELEAYAIGGHNYVKLRDVGQAVDFNVAYDPARNAAIIEPDKPYTGEDVGTAGPAPTLKPSVSVDYAAQADPAIFTGNLTREVYNGIRDSIVHQEDILAERYRPVPVGDVSDDGLVAQVVSSFSRYPAYGVERMEDGEKACVLYFPEAYEAAAVHTQSFVDSLEGKSQREKVEEICWYVSDRMTYAVEYPSPGEVLSQDGQIPGCCMAYAYSFQFLCNRANIPCFLIQNPTHQWNKVYVDGQWWDVDVSGSDVGDNVEHRDQIDVLHPEGYFQGSIFIDGAPEATAFLKELLAPGSTK